MDSGLFKNKYRIKSARREGYDYSQDGLYFTTICTKDRKYFFGKIINKKMILNQLGKMADKYWQEIPAHFPFVKLNEYIIMPNHVHGIIVIDNDTRGDNGMHGKNGVRRDAINRVSTNADIVTNADINGGGITGKYNPMGKNTLGEIIRWYKGRCKFESKTINPNFAWQSRFYDHIIRNEKSSNRIRQYIIDNPRRWELDRNNDENVWM